jgi:3'(2'), 5'-bisphosphate nucleotidase
VEWIGAPPRSASADSEASLQTCRASGWSPASPARTSGRGRPGRYRIGVPEGGDGGDDAQLAADLARRAGELLLEIRASGLRGHELGEAGDLASHRLIVEALAADRPGDAVLSEEGQDDPGRLRSRRVWIVDPLDGTREFREPPRTDWAVHVALWADGDLTAGAVAMPGREMVLTSAAPPRRAAAADPLRIVVSRTRAPVWVADVASRLGAKLVPLGSAGAKVAAVVLGEADIYLHGGGQYEWDSAAPVAVARAAGLHTSRLDGDPLRYNQPVPELPDLVVCPAELAPTVQAALTATAS